MLFSPINFLLSFCFVKSLELSFYDDSDKYENNVVIISRENCKYSQNMRNLLQEKHPNYVDLNVDLLLADVRIITNYPTHTFPLVFVDGKFFGGYDEAKNSTIFSNQSEKVGEYLDQIAKLEYKPE